MGLKIVSNNNQLQFEAAGTLTDTEEAFLLNIKNYKLQAQGATILISDQNNRLISCIKPFDNTQLICTEDGYGLAALFGAKRFLVGEARKRLNEKTATAFSVIEFPRDLSINFQALPNIQVNYQVADLADALKLVRLQEDEFYTSLTELFLRCADFTPAKQEEYSEGKKQGRYCNFNQKNNNAGSPVSTEQVFLFDDKKKIMGTVSATLVKNDDASVDVYFYDEVVDYFTLLNESEKATFNVLLNDKEKNKGQIAALIEPKRNILMAQLFAAAKQQIGAKIGDHAEVRAFIRAADGRVDNYAAILGCEKANSGNYVIHGRPTAELGLLDGYVKAWAKNQLSLLKPKVSDLTFKAPQESGVSDLEMNALNSLHH